MLKFGIQFVLVTSPLPALGSLSSTRGCDPTQNPFAKENPQFLGRFNGHWVGFVSLEDFRDSGVFWEGLGAANVPGLWIISEIMWLELGFFLPKIGNISLESSSWKEIQDTLNFGPFFCPKICHFQAQILHSHTGIGLSLLSHWGANFGWILTSHTKNPPQPNPWGFSCQEWVWELPFNPRECWKMNLLWGRAVAWNSPSPTWDPKALDSGLFLPGRS